MPVYSMTGYASLQATHAAADNESSGSAAPAGEWLLALELRAVNSRFLDLSFKLPEELRPFESALRERLQRRLRRGKLELRGTLELQGGAAGGLQAPSAHVLQRLAAAQDAVLTWLPQAVPLSVGEVLRLGQNQAATALPPDALRDWLLQATDDLLERFQQARATEGAQLAESLLQRVQGLRDLAQQAEPLIPALVERQRARFVERWNDALRQTQSAGATTAVAPESAQERALAEATAFAIRIDVAEELTRLQTHLQTIEQLLHQGGELGKRLDFLIQELHREANTLGSKSAVLETSRIAVDMKVLIEQMREQVQNLE